MCQVDWSRGLAEIVRRHLAAGCPFDFKRRPQIGDTPPVGKTPDLGTVAVNASAELLVGQALGAEIFDERHVGRLPPWQLFCQRQSYRCGARQRRRLRLRFGVRGHERAAKLLDAFSPDE